MYYSKLHYFHVWLIKKFSYFMLMMHFFTYVTAEFHREVWSVYAHSFSELKSSDGLHKLLGIITAYRIADSGTKALYKKYVHSAVCNCSPFWILVNYVKSNEKLVTSLSNTVTRLIEDNKVQHTVMQALMDLSNVTHIIIPLTSVELFAHVQKHAKVFGGSIPKHTEILNIFK